jgi:hypothetical protein
MIRRKYFLKRDKKAVEENDEDGKDIKLKDDIEPVDRKISQTGN